LYTFKDAPNCFIFRRGVVNSSRGIEGALKLKEISYIHAERVIQSVEWCYATTVLIDESMPVVVIAPKWPL
jgi:glucosamine 6-phosphate synthetase-like amidotransferase/phosphosugar isomerase protein